MAVLGNHRARVRSLWVTDLLVIAACLLWSPIIRLGWELGFYYVEKNVFSFALVALIFMFSLHLADVYRPRRLPVLQEIVATGIAVVVAEIMSAILFYAYWPLRLGRGVMLISGAMIFCGVVTRLISYSSVQELVRMKCLLVDIDFPLKQLVMQMESGPLFGLEIQADVTRDELSPGTGGSRHVTVPTWKDLPFLAEELRAQCVVTHLREDMSAELVEGLIACDQRGIGVVDLFGLYEDLLEKVPFRCIRPNWFLYAQLGRSDIYSQRIKRVLDILFSAAALVLSSPIFVLAALAIKATSSGAVVYEQDRVGLDGKPFRLLKFRSMVEGAEEDTGPVWSHEGDRRVTGIGRILRRFRIDELPQLINVLRGDMSLVGPRPERPEIISSALSNIPYYMNRSHVRPGLTGWAQINYSYAGSVDETEAKLEYDFYYIKNMSLSLDILILLTTFRVMLTTRGS